VVPFKYRVVSVKKPENLGEIIENSEKEKVSFIVVKKDNSQDE
jgi:hypothetical protein